MSGAVDEVLPAAGPSPVPGPQPASGPQPAPRPQPAPTEVDPAVAAALDAMDPQPQRADPDPAIQAALDLTDPVQGMRAAFYGADAAGTAARAARVQQVAGQLGLPPAIVDQNLEAMEGRARFAAVPFAAIARENPVLANWLLERRHAQLAQDDLPELRALERASRVLAVGTIDDPLGILPAGFRFTPDGTIVEANAPGDPGHVASQEELALGTGANRRAVPAGQRVYASLQELSGELVRRANAADLAALFAKEDQEDLKRSFGPFAQVAAGAAGTISSTERVLGLIGPEQAALEDRQLAAYSALSPGFTGGIQRGVGGLLASLPMMLAGGPFAKAAESLGVLSMTARTLTPVLGAVRAAGAAERVGTALAMVPQATITGLAAADQTGSKTYGAIEGLINTVIPAAFGRVGLSRFLAPAVGEVGAGGAAAWRPAAGFLLRQAGLDASQNAAVDLASALHEVASGADPEALDPGKLAMRLVTSGTLGFALGGIFNLPDATRIRLTRDALAIRQAQVESTALGEHFSAALASKTRGRAPELVGALVADTQQTAGRDGGTVYFQGDAWREHFQQQGEDPAAAAAAMGVDAPSYRAALAGDAALAVPLAGWTARLRAQDRPLLAHAVLHADGLTPHQAESATQELRILHQEAVQRHAAGADDTSGPPAGNDAAQADAIHASAAAVRERVQAQAVAAGMPPAAAAEQARLWEAFTRTRALEYAGEGRQVLPEDILKRFHVTVSRDAGAGSQGGPRAPGGIHRVLMQEGAADQQQPGGPAEQPDHAVVTRRLGERLAQPDAAEAYARLPGTLDGKLLNVDLARELSPDYTASKAARRRLSAATHEPASAFIKQRFNQLLMEHDGQPVLLLAGGGGSGKSRALTGPLHAAAEGAGVVFDGVMGDPESATKRIHAILDGTRSPVTVAYVHKPFHEAVAAVIARAERVGRVVPLTELARAHAGANRTILELQRRFAGNPRVSFHIFDNAGNRMVRVPIALLENLTYARGDESIADTARRMESEVPHDHAARIAASAASAASAEVVRELPGAGRDLSDRRLRHDGGRRADDPGRDREAGGREGASRADGAADAAAGHQQLEHQEGAEFQQDARGRILVGADGSLSIRLGPGADLSTLPHESAHAFLEIMGHLAGEDDAPARLRAQYRETLAWLGAEAGHAPSVAQHERFARGFEAYLLEGKAPSGALRRTFAALKGWLTAIYHAVANLHVPLDPGIRRVFDRLLASDAEIAHAATALHAEPLFADAATAGMTPAAFAAYRRAAADALAHANDALRATVLHGELPAERARRQEVEEQVRVAQAAVVDARPDIRALTALQRGVAPAGATVAAGRTVKLDRAELVARYGEAGLRKLPGPTRAGGEARANAGRHVYTTDGGMDLASAVQLFGYRDADQLYEALVQAPDRAALIAHQTADEMARRFPDPLLDPTLATRAMALVADAFASDVVTREVQALAQRVGGAATPRAIMRQTAERTVGSMRASTVRPEAYRVAAARAGRALAKAVDRLRTAESPEVLNEQGAQERARHGQEALRLAQRRQLNLELFSAARQARDAGVQVRALIAMHDTPAAREHLGQAGGWQWTVTGRDGTQRSFASEAEALAAVRSRTGATNPGGAQVARTSAYLDQWDNLLEGVGIRRAGTAAAQRESLPQFVARLTAAGEPVDIAARPGLGQGRKHWRELTVDEQREAGDALANIRQLAMRRHALAHGTLEQVASAITSGLAAHAPVAASAPAPAAPAPRGDMIASPRSDAVLVRSMDGDRDGGALWTAFIAPRAAAAKVYHERQRQENMRRTTDLIAWGGRIGGGSDDIPGTHLRLSHEQRIGLALHWGHAAGRRSVLADLAQRAEPAGQADVEAVLATLTAGDRHLLHATWEQLAALHREAAAVARRLTGVTPQAVAAVPYHTPYGLLSGGYSPLLYERDAGGRGAASGGAADAAERLREANVAASRQRQGGPREGGGLRYDFAVVDEQLTALVHGLAYRALAQDQNRLLRHPPVRAALAGAHGLSIVGHLTLTLADLLTGELPAQLRIGRVQRCIQRGMPGAVFGRRVVGALVERYHVPRLVAQLGVERLLQAVAHVGGGAARMVRAISEAEGASAFLAARAGAARGVAGAQAQRVIDTIIWHAGYDHGLAAAQAAGLDGAVAHALAFADRMVREHAGASDESSQSATAALLASYQRGVADLRAELVGASDRPTADDLLAQWFVPAVLSERIAGELHGGVAQVESAHGFGLLAGWRTLAGGVHVAPHEPVHAGPGGMPASRSGEGAPVEPKGALEDAAGGTGDGPAQQGRPSDPAAPREPADVFLPNSRAPAGADDPRTGVQVHRLQDLPELAAWLAKVTSAEAGPSDEIAQGMERTWFSGAGHHYVLDTHGNTVYAEGRITGAHPKRDKQRSRPIPANGLTEHDHRGHLIPENGVHDPRDVNRQENFIPEGEHSNLSLKKRFEKRVMTLADAHPDAVIRTRHIPLRRAGESRPYAVTHVILMDGKVVHAESFGNLQEPPPGSHAAAEKAKRAEQGQRRRQRLGPSPARKPAP